MRLLPPSSTVHRRHRSLRSCHYYHKCVAFPNTTIASFTGRSSVASALAVVTPALPRSFCSIITSSASFVTTPFSVLRPPHCKKKMMAMNGRFE
ncbi:hypothetical protein PIB30_040351 [Stylosanthes scabra]|uniref:Uncharacterized protein n=1 Tax=Stylosanthes scabra TaxID=79078 RepID=A0ABU6VFB5_9FABA|nr:hypothetical protein [Stylosanthes scabra]